MKDKDQLRERFVAAIDGARKKVERYESLTRPIAPDNAIGRVSRMDAINNRAITDAALRKAREHLSGLLSHFEGLDDPDFGHCARCKKEIPIQRILLAPESRFCVNCARI